MQGARRAATTAGKGKRPADSSVGRPHSSVKDSKKGVTINLKKNLYFEFGGPKAALDVRTPPTSRSKVGAVRVCRFQSSDVFSAPASLVENLGSTYMPCWQHCGMNRCVVGVRHISSFRLSSTQHFSLAVSHHSGCNEHDGWASCLLCGIVGRRLGLTTSMTIECGVFPHTQRKCFRCSSSLHCLSQFHHMLCVCQNVAL